MRRASIILILLMNSESLKDCGAAPIQEFRMTHQYEELFAEIDAELQELKLKIGSSQSSLQLQAAIAKTAKGIERAYRRLSTGSRLAEIRDDVAGFATNVSMTSGIKSFGRIAKNINEALARLNTADGALMTQVDIVHRMRELAMQASSELISASDRTNLENEFQTLKAEFDRITNATEFNGEKLLDGTYSDREVFLGTNRRNITLSMRDTQLTSIFETEGNYSYSSETEPTGLLSAVSIFPTGGASTKGGFADFGEDGNLDFVVGNSAGQIAVRLGLGTGSFVSGATLNLGHVVSDLVVADFDNDDDMDFVYSEASTDTINVRLGNGTGGFTIPGAGASYGLNPDSITVGHFNNDSNIDLLVANSGSNNIRVLRGNGNGTFTAMATIALAAAPTNIVSGQFDADPDLDFAITLSNGSLNTYSGNNGFGFVLVGSTPMGATAVTTHGLKAFDRNGDNIQDVAVAISGGFTQIRTYQNNGSGTMSLSSNLALPSAPTGVAVGEFTGDSQPELIASLATGAIWLIGSPYTSAYSGLVGAAGTNSSLVGDFTNDSFNDMIQFTGGNTYVYRGLTNTTVTESGTPDIPFSIETVEEAEDMLDVLDSALQNLMSRRAHIGSQQGRLDSAMEYSLMMNETLSQSRQHYKDADIAEEIAELTRHQIMQQVQVALNTQVNMQLQLVTALLENLR